MDIFPNYSNKIGVRKQSKWEQTLEWQSSNCRQVSCSIYRRLRKIVSEFHNALPKLHQRFQTRRHSWSKMQLPWVIVEWFPKFQPAARTVKVLVHNIFDSFCFFWIFFLDFESSFFNWKLLYRMIWNDCFDWGGRTVCRKWDRGLFLKSDRYCYWFSYEFY